MFQTTNQINIYISQSGTHPVDGGTAGSPLVIDEELNCRVPAFWKEEALQQ